MQNVSHYDLMVEITNGPTVVLRPGETMDDKEINNYNQISQFIRAVVEMQEVNPPPGGKLQYLKG